MYFVAIPVGFMGFLIFKKKRKIAHLGLDSVWRKGEECSLGFGRTGAD